MCPSKEFKFYKFMFLFINYLFKCWENVFNSYAVTYLIKSKKCESIFQSFLIKFFIEKFTMKMPAAWLLPLVA